jgi:hypothetical protein
LFQTIFHISLSFVIRQERLRKLQEEKEKGPEFANIQLRGSKTEMGSNIISLSLFYEVEFFWICFFLCGDSGGEVTSPRKEEPTPEWVVKATQKREIVDPRAGREYNPKEGR